MGRDPLHHRPSPPPPSPHGEQPLVEGDVVKMRARIADMGFSSDAKVQNLTSKEKELGGMVVRLLDSFIDPSQLLRQAEFITWLGSQRDLLVRSFEEERQRWEAEREGWNRMAEALLAQQAKIGNTTSRKGEEVEHQHNIHESENKALREKLQDYQLRFSALESELNKLKPLLLMQPPISNPSAERLSDLKSLKTRRRTVDTPSVGEHANSKDNLTANQPDDSTLNTPRSEYYRRHPPARSSFFTPLRPRTSTQQTPMRSVFSVSQTPSTHPGSSKKSKHKSKKSHHSNLLSLSADARTEHLLLAARKIGRERANMISGFMRRIEKERESLMQEQDAERLDREKAAAGFGHTPYRKDVIDLGTGSSSVASSIASSMPKTPKRGNAEGQSMTHFLTPTTLMTPRSDLYPSLNNAPSSFVFVGSPSVASYQNSVFTPRPAGLTQASTPAAKTTGRPSATPAAHPTPLASLLSAAKSMMDDESNEPSTVSNSRRRASAVEPPDSPVPKRRRVGNGNTSSSRGQVDMLAAASTLGTDRVRSALDVLADQAAAAFDSDWQSPSKSPAKVAIRSRGKDKGYTATCPPVVPGEDMLDDSTPKGRVQSVERSAALVRTGSPVSTRSRSRALLTDRLSKGTSRSRQKEKDKPSGTLTPGALNEPRVIFSPVLRSPTLPLSPSPTAVTSPSIPAEDGNDPDRAIVDEENRPQKRFLDDDNPTSNGGTSHSPVLSNMGDDQPRILGDPISIGPENAHISSSRFLMAIDNEPDNKGETSASGNGLSEFLRENHEGEGDSAAVDSRDGEETKGVEQILVEEGTQVTMTEGREAQGHIVHGDSPDVTYDTDADAEGEMDVEAEETVFMDSSSSMINVPVVSGSSLGASDVINQPTDGRESRGTRPTEP